MYSLFGEASLQRIHFMANAAVYDSGGAIRRKDNGLFGQKIIQDLHVGVDE